VVEQGTHKPLVASSTLASATSPIARVGSFSDPRMPAEIVELTRGGAQFVQLAPEQAALITRELAAELPVAETV
jgi:hypothetical protein